MVTLVCTSLSGHGKQELTIVVVATGGTPPSLDETRSRVVANVLDRDAAKEASDNRKELFGLAKKPKKPGKRAIDSVEIEESDTSLRKLKDDLFAMPAKKKVEAPPKEMDDQEKPHQKAEAAPDNIEDFKAQLFGDAASAIAAPTQTSPLAKESASSATTSSPSATPLEPRASASPADDEEFVEAPPELRNALFAQPAKKEAAMAPVVAAATIDDDDQPEFELDSDDSDAELAPSQPVSVGIPQFEAAAPVVKTGDTHVVEELYEGDLLSDEDSDGDLC